MPSNIEDQRKLHAAVNQIDNQRVILSTLAIDREQTAQGNWTKVLVSDLAEASAAKEAATSSEGL